MASVPVQKARARWRPVSAFAWRQPCHHRAPTRERRCRRAHLRDLHGRVQKGADLGLVHGLGRLPARDVLRQRSRPPRCGRETGAPPVPMPERGWCEGNSNEIAGAIGRVALDQRGLPRHSATNPPRPAASSMARAAGVAPLRCRPGRGPSRLNVTVAAFRIACPFSIAVPIGMAAVWPHRMQCASQKPRAAHPVRFAEIVDNTPISFAPGQKRNKRIDRHTGHSHADAKADRA